MAYRILSVSSNQTLQLGNAKNTLYDIDFSLLQPNAKMTLTLYDVEGAEIGSYTLSDNFRLEIENLGVGTIITQDATSYTFEMFMHSKRVSDYECANASAHIRVFKNTQQISYNGEYLNPQQIRNLDFNDLPGRNWILGSTDKPDRGWNLGSSDVPNRGWTLGSSDVPNRGWTLGTGDTPGRSWTLTETLNTDLYTAGDYFKTGDAVAPIDIAKTTNSGGDISITESGSQVAISSTSLIVRHVQFVNAGTHIMYVGVGNANVPLYPNWIWLWDANPDEQTDLSNWTTNGTSGDVLNINYQV